MLRCLDKNPAVRPVSAISVAARLPGGDPLAAALAAGETPSPAMVAAAGESAGLRPRVATACLAGFFVLMAAVVALVSQYGITRIVPLDYPPDVLANKAQEMIGRFGYTEKPRDTAYGLSWNSEYIAYVGRTDKSPNRWAAVREGREAAIEFWYRTSPRYLAAHEYFGSGVANGRVGIDDPSEREPGQQKVWLSSSGRLLRFEAVPPPVEPPQKAPVPIVNWQSLFEAGGLDIAAFKPADPMWAPPAWGDARAAWIETAPVGAEAATRIEAAAWRGQPIFFRVINAWTPGQGQSTPAPTMASRVTQALVIGFIAAMVIGAIVLARYNLAHGRGDLRGASRLAVFVCAMILTGWAIEASHVAAWWEVPLFILGFSYALFAAAAVWCLYVALEPFIRKLWPHTIISWSRLLAGRLADPLVGRDLLVGLMCGALFSLSIWGELALRTAYGFSPFPKQTGLDALLGSRFIASSAIAYSYSAIVNTLGLFVVVFLLRLLLRRDWLAGGALVLFGAVGSLTTSTDLSLVTAGFNLVTLLVFVTLLLRFGLVAITVANFVSASLTTAFPISAEFSRWYGGGTVVVLLAFSALAVYGYRLSLGGRRRQSTVAPAGAR